MEEDAPEIPFSQRPDFADLAPVEQNDGPSPVCPIAYTKEFLDSMNYFRAVLGADERTPRALEVTNRVIKYNSACYTAWYFKRLILEALKADLQQEMNDLAAMAKQHPKNYQIWYHRRWLVEQTRDASRELAFTAEILEEDAKNYHAWSHRQWVIKTFKLFEKELEYVESLLVKDVRNNSAWNQRYFVVFHTDGLTPEATSREIKFAQTKICQSPNNECPWNYLVGLFKGKKISENEEVVTFCLEKVGKWPHCANLYSLLFDIEEQKGNFERARELRDSLDDIHKKYWAYRLTLLPAQQQQ